MSDKVTLTIDDQQVTAKSGLKIVDAAKTAGIDISVFCYHPKLEPVGACRLCLVEIGRPQRDRATGELLLQDDGTPQIYYSGNLETACTVPVAEGLVVHTANEKVLEARENILEFILTSHPLDCPVCDKGGECSLQELTFSFGIPESRFPLDQKIQLGKHMPLGDLILLDQERCIQCGRCIRFQKEIAGDPVLAFYNRGRKTEIVSYSNPPFDSYWSGNTTDICPVGALTTRDFRFEARVWEMEAIPSICSHCPVGCNITINTRMDPKSGKTKIQRIMPRQNEWVNELWICDKGRFAHQFTSSSQRLTHPLARDKNGKLTQVSWKKALDLAAERLRSTPKGLVTLVGGRLANEDYYQLKKLSEAYAGQAIMDTSMAGGDLAATLSPGPGYILQELGEGTTILVAACDLEEEAPVWWLRVKAAAERGATLIVLNARKTKLDRYAHYQIRYKYGRETRTLLDLKEKEKDAFQSIKKAENLLIFFGCEGMDYKASKSFSQACANLLIQNKKAGKTNSGLVPIWSKVNTQGAWDMGFEPVDNLAEILEKAETLIVAGADPAADGYASQLINKFVIALDLFHTETAEMADLVLPAAAPTEKTGTYTSGDRRLQLFERAIEPLGESLPDLEIINSLVDLLDLEITKGDTEQLLAEIIEGVPGYGGVTKAGLKHSPEQWPFVAKEALSFTGTVFKNTSGVGMPLDHVSDPGGLKEDKVSQPRAKFSQGNLAVPITRLYDRGIMLSTSEVLEPRLETCHFIVNPADAKILKLQDNDQIEIVFNGSQYRGQVCLDEVSPPGVFLVPRRMGVPLRSPVNVEIKRLD
jgi:NADH-quinone oxidoreductase subunit G